MRLKFLFLYLCIVSVHFEHMWVQTELTSENENTDFSQRSISSFSSSWKGYNVLIVCKRHMRICTTLMLSTRLSIYGLIQKYCDINWSYCSTALRSYCSAVRTRIHTLFFFFYCSKTSDLVWTCVPSISTRLVRTFDSRPVSVTMQRLSEQRLELNGIFYANMNEAVKHLHWNCVDGVHAVMPAGVTVCGLGVP